MDVLDGKEFYTEWFTFKPTEALNDKFEMMDIENKNFIYNSGSYLIIMVIIISYNIIYTILNFIAVKCRRF